MRAADDVSPFVTLYDGKDNKVGLTVDPTTTLKNLAGGSYYVDVSGQPRVRLVGRVISPVLTVSRRPRTGDDDRLLLDLRDDVLGQGREQLAREVAGDRLVRVRRPRRRLSGGSSVAQISGLPSRSRSQQRVWKRQPDGGSAGLGMSPLRMIRRRDRSVRASGTGTADSRATVYGWSGCA